MEYFLEVLTLLAFLGKHVLGDRETALAGFLVLGELDQVLAAVLLLALLLVIGELELILSTLLLLYLLLLALGVELVGVVGGVLGTTGPCHPRTAHHLAGHPAAPAAAGPGDPAPADPAACAGP